VFVTITDLRNPEPVWSYCANGKANTQTCCCANTQRPEGVRLTDRQTNRQTDGWTDDSIMTIVDHTLLDAIYDRLKSDTDI